MNMDNLLTMNHFLLHLFPHPAGVEYCNTRIMKHNVLGMWWVSVLQDKPLLSQNINVLFPRQDAVNGLLMLLVSCPRKQGQNCQGKGHNLVVKQTWTRILVLQLLATRIASSPNTCLLNWKSRRPYVFQQDGCEEDAESRWLIPIQCLPCIRSWANTGGFPPKLLHP